MPRLSNVVCAALAASSASSVMGEKKVANAVDDVIDLLSNLKNDVSSDLDKEKSTFGEFDGFCKNTRAERTDAIKTGELHSEESQGTITSKNTDLSQTETDIAAAKDNGEKLENQKTASARQCDKDEAAYDATNADLEAAIAGLEGAVEKLSASKAAAFVQLRAGGKAFMQPLKKSLDLAEALGFLDAKKRQAVGAFLQGGKAGPDPWLNDAGAEKNKEDYKFQSDGIVGLLSDLLKKFQDDKASTDSTWDATKKACEDTAQAKTDAIAANTENIAKLDEQAATLRVEIADEEETLINTKKTLREDNHYLSELNENCAARTRDFNQRSAQMESEIKAIEAALGVMTDTVKGLDGEVNLAALAPASFLQNSAVSHVAISSHSFGKVSANARTVTTAEVQMMLTSASRYLAKAGVKHNSARLSGLALRMNLGGLAKQTPEDGTKSPLQVVKETVQKLVNEILEESKAEAEKKGACDTSMNKQKMERVRRLNEAKRLNAKLESLEARRVRLEDENAIMSDELADFREKLLNGDEMRAEESEQNRVTMEKADQGSKAVKAAAAELEAFYRAAGNSADKHNKGAFLQKKQPPEVAEGAYSGNQESGANIISLMENIGRDFDKTFKDTKESEEKAADDFTKFKSSSKQMIADRETGIELNTQYLDETHDNLEKGHNDLTNTMALLDAALESLVDLKSQCVDQGMSFKERQRERDEQIEDLKTALCLLDPTNAGPECAEILAENR
eukprot:TRINITY_DN1152_c0_g1_i2.p1 TRINITY_DN1152_c0_g1~~TRINITY_DN1152_c0_g1_i2.p1  ORF type:complete len:738 (-),score=250.14 TRINITY_DN1152_c0_g1_i2:180-2393(-)